MKIYLHIGTEKTGSSHLQSIAGINRKRLIEEGIWFPEAGLLEHQLVKGEISAGNAQDITDALTAEDYKVCSEIIGRHILKANELSCDSLFLSNELLVLALAKSNRLKQFESVLNNHGYTDKKYLLIIRDPVDQALSLYKHRAKNGRTDDIEDWPQRNYLYGDCLLSFLRIAENQGINLTCRKFSKQSGALERILFQEWLGLDYELEVPQKVVNPSLSLSELLLLQKVRQYDPNLTNILYNRFLDVGKEDKAEQTTLDQYHQDVLSNFLARYKETWNACNAHLPDSEKLHYPHIKDSEELAKAKISAFSDSQMEVISAIIADSLTFRFKFRFEYTKWRSRIGRIRNKLLNR